MRQPSMTFIQSVQHSPSFSSQSSLTKAGPRVPEESEVPKSIGLKLKRSRSFSGLSLSNIVADFHKQVEKLSTDKDTYIIGRTNKYCDNIIRYEAEIRQREIEITKLEEDLKPDKERLEKLASQLLNYNELIENTKLIDKATLIEMSIDLSDIKKRAQDTAQKYRDLNIKILPDSNKLLKYQDDILKFEGAITKNKHAISKVKREANDKFDIQIVAFETMISKYEEHHK